MSKISFTKRSRIKVSEVMKSLKVLLEYLLKETSKVFIIGHKEPDFDSIGS